MSGLRLLESIALPDLGQEACCQVYESRQAKRMWLKICSDQGLRLIIPSRFRFKDRFAREFIKKNYPWIVRNWHKLQNKQRKEIVIPDRIDLGNRVVEAHKMYEYAKEMLINRTAEIAKDHNISYNNILVKLKKKHWGSCTSKQNLSYNWRIAFLPVEMRDYIICHELAHLRQFNHSGAFWQEVVSMCPEARQINQSLKNYLCY